MAEVEDIMSHTDIEELGNSMKEELRNCISSDIGYDSGSKFCLIPKIHEHIRIIDRYSYEPIIVSIGPYHNGSPEFSSMEKEKWNCLDYILKSNCEKGLKEYLTVMNRLEKQARMCYSGDIKMKKKKFLQTLLLDGCFVLVSLGGFNEFMRTELRMCMASSSHVPHEEDCSRYPELTKMNEIQQINSSDHNAVGSTVVEQDNVNSKYSREESLVLDIGLSSELSAHQKDCQYQDHTQQIGRWYDIFVSLDLLLLENQIPFFVVEGLHEVVLSNMAPPPTACSTSVARHMEMFLPLYPIAIRESSRPKDFDHLLHLCHMYFRPSSNQDEHHEHTVQNSIHYFLKLGHDYLSLLYKQEAANLGLSQDGHFPNRRRRATQYHEAGIEFRRRTYSERNPHSLLDIKFRDGVLEIPFLFVDEKTNVLFRNFVALEQTCPQVGNEVTTYIVFLAKLMSMPDDVALLARKGVIAHHMRTDRDVSLLFTRLTKGVVFDFYGNYYLKHMCLALEVYYQNRLHRWVAWLRHNHLSNPWLVVAALAGVIVLFCTIAQTVLTVESYVNPK